MTTLQQLLMQMRAALALRRPSPEQDAAVLLLLQQQLQQQSRRQTQASLVLAGPALTASSRWQRPLVGAGALLTLLALAFALSLLRLDRPAPAPDLGYLPLVSAEQWAQVQNGGEPVWIVPTELPRERLALMGLPYDPARAAEAVRADVMLHRNGQVLAVRFVQ
ncbi:hypothetical protein HNQ51_000007 [Inhella inkyongensis]|uniref:Uncharacterized protein n=1 Tax=Inhella inkyongensis TaxID=392593 RepID=A0A840S1H7_9BURK|nr:hypothetical protein [Inhella inkyongensis]MBB5202714.1 hypothetical protein [Inhella inkyongensis]